MVLGHIGGVQPTDRQTESTQSTRNESGCIYLALPVLIPTVCLPVHRYKTLSKSTLTLSVCIDSRWKSVCVGEGRSFAISPLPNKEVTNI